MALTKVGKEGVTGISNSSNATAITIDSSENVGIGKSTSIADRVHIEKSGANCLLSVARTSDGAAGRLVMQHTNTVGALQTTGSVPLTLGTADSERIRIDAAGAVKIKSTGGATPTYSHTSNGEGLTFRYNDDSGARAADIVAVGNTPAGATMAMRFFTSPNSTDNAAEVMRIANNVVSVGGTNATAKFNVVGQGGSNVQLQNNIATGTGAIVQIGFLNDNGLVGSIQTSGSATSYVTSSDYRLKTAVNYDWDATTRLKQLKPARFKWISDGDDAVFVDGFIADEAQTVVPESVTGTKDEVEVWKDSEELPDGVSAGDNKLDDDGNTIPVYQGIDQSKIVPLLTKALIESVEKIEQLEARITALEA